MFCCREVIFSMVFSHLGTGCKGGQNSWQQQEEKGAKSIIFYGLQKLCILGFSVLQRHGVLLPGGDFFHGVFPFGDRM